MTKSGASVGRLAPSPTGAQHVGNARTYLLAWLSIRSRGGRVVLRIEDIDSPRVKRGAAEQAIEDLRWLGLDWDEGPDIGGPHAPYFQSERLDRYRAMADDLVASGRAYYCYCSTELIQQKRQAAEAAGGGRMYDRTCLSLSAEQSAALAASGAPRAVRFKVAGGQTQFDDRVRGSITFDNANIEDFVILRSDRHPTYHLTVVADDIEMGMTDVIRGDDHISNTPKQVLLYRAFDREPPRVAHVPLFLGPDTKRLSKRHGATSVMEYHRMGYLSEAMVNFLALLGWSPGTDQEIFTRDELVAAFALEGISGGNAVFNPDKLDWFKQQHIMRLAIDDLASRVQPLLVEAGLWRAAYESGEREWFHRVLDLLKPRVKKLGQFVEDGRPFLADEIEYDAAAVEKHLRAAGMRAHLLELSKTFAGAEAFDKQSTELMLRSVAERASIKPAQLIHATRVAIPGRTVSPGLYEVLELIGRARACTRIERAASLSNE
jgi:glutamyl-tRNA synthetase